MPTLPGPPRTPLVGNLLDFRRDRLAFFTDLASTYGDVARFWMGPQEVLAFSHPDHVHDVLVAGAGRIEKGPVLQRAKVVLGDGLLTSEGDLHRRQRELVQPALTGRRVHGYVDDMVDAATRVADAWTAGVPVDVHEAMLGLTVQAAGRAFLSTDVDEEGVATAVEDILAAYDTAFLPLQSVVHRLPLGPIRRLRRGVRWLNDFVGEVIRLRRVDPGRHDDVLRLLVDSPMDDTQVRDEVVTLLLAGHETTASALTWALHLLAADPPAQARLQEEVDQVVAGRRPAAADTRALRWAGGVVSEALRLYPPSWAMGRRAVEDLRVDDVPVTAGTPMVVSQWVIHRDPRWWPDPDRFDPGRWLRDDGDRPRYAFFPFGAGPRRCVGEAFALTETVLALAVVAQRWTLVPHRARVVEPVPLLTLRPRGVGVVPRPR